MTTSQIQQLIAEARLPEALAALKETVPAHLLTEVVHLQSRLHQLQRKERLGVLDEKDVGVERNKITAAALDLCNEIDSTTPASDTKEGKTIIQNAEKIYNIEKLTTQIFLELNL